MKQLEGGRKKKTASEKRGQNKELPVLRNIANSLLVIEAVQRMHLNYAVLTKIFSRHFILFISVFEMQ